MGNYFMATHQDCPLASTDKAKGREPSMPYLYMIEKGRSEAVGWSGAMLTGLTVGSEHPTLTEARVTLPSHSTKNGWEPGVQLQLIVKVSLPFKEE